MQGNWIKTDQPCPCGDGRSSYATDAKGNGHCFKCGKHVWADKEEGYVANEASTMQFIPWRGVTRDTMVFFGVKTEVGPDNVPRSVFFSLPNGRTQVRYRDSKDFRTLGTVETGKNPLFGSDKFGPGSAQAVTITEGYIDAMSAFQMLGSKYPAVAFSSATQARAECNAAFEYLNSFEKIYLCTDADEPGLKAADAIASLFDFNKVYHVKLDPTLKDANGYLDGGKHVEFTRTWWAAKRFLPEGVLSTFAEFDKIIDEEDTKPSVPYPFERLQEMTYGIRTGELLLFTAQEGIGKTEVFRALEYNLLKNTKEKVGIIHLEESKSRTIKGLAGYELKKPAHLPDSQVSKEEIKNAFHSLSGSDERLHIYSHFGSDDPDVILNTIRFMAGPCECRYVFLDHITLVVTGLQSEDERKQLDYISTKLAMMVEDHDFACFLISHVNDDGLTRGSRNISKVADLHVHLDRDITAPTADLRNVTSLTVRKNRFAGKTGPAGFLTFDPATFMLTERMEMPTNE